VVLVVSARGNQKAISVGMGRVFRRSFRKLLTYVLKGYRMYLSSKVRNTRLRSIYLRAGNCTVSYVHSYQVQKPGCE